MIYLVFSGPPCPGCPGCPTPTPSECPTVPRTDTVTVTRLPVTTTATATPEVFIQVGTLAKMSSPLTRTTSTPCPTPPPSSPITTTNTVSRPGKFVCGSWTRREGAEKR